MSNPLDPNDPHYMTPGAREQFDRYRTRTTLAFLVLAVAFIVGVWGMTERTDKNIRRDINRIAQQQCISSIPTLKKFNTLVNNQIIISREAREIALDEKDIDRVRLNTRNIIRLQNSKLSIPTKDECMQRVLIQE